MLTVVPESGDSETAGAAGNAGSSPISMIDEIVRDGARRMLAAALQAEAVTAKASNPANG